ncbi:hypothetical protein EUX98_g4524 [Antrodiella citrinella]|uniref:Uncharacterized protein n=1 Tax=Antrodiella citrinella TaxID=2447956 RepID=A0A4S4MWA0_9APHY|nr:hypothetical protein EUX98_g4524 [Antrodiella citrinella]
MDGDEAYILLLLSDSNLPTGSFVASSGLESYATHGFLSDFGGAQDTKSMPNGTVPIVEFVRSSLLTYSRTALPFVTDAHGIVQRHIAQRPWLADITPEDNLRDVLRDVTAVDELYDVMTLNHVTRRASRSQGVALLTLFSKGFAKSSVPGEGTDQGNARDVYLSRLVDELKLLVCL